MKKENYLITCALAAVLALSGCGTESTEPTPSPDPHAGQVEVLYGSEGPVWVDLQEGVAVSAFAEEDFSEDGQYRLYSGTAYEALAGIDVSEHQGTIDWEEVARSGVDFVMIRAGYRGSTTGGLYMDEYFHDNITGASAAGLEIGIYFFSQAANQAEASAEAHYLLALLDSYRDVVTLPVVFDWEETGTENARTREVTGAEVTACAETFCETVRTAGYTPGVYFNRHMGYYSYDFTNLQNETLWFAGEGSWPDFYYRHQMWQYSFSGQIPGIQAAVDLDLYLKPLED